MSISAAPGRARWPPEAVAFLDSRRAVLALPPSLPPRPSSPPSVIEGAHDDHAGHDDHRGRFLADDGDDNEEGANT